jgi:hypothetical protein
VKFGAWSMYWVWVWLKRKNLKENWVKENGGESGISGAQRLFIYMGWALEMIFRKRSKSFVWTCPFTVSALYIFSCYPISFLYPSFTYFQYEQYYLINYFYICTKCTLFCSKSKRLQTLFSFVSSNTIFHEFQTLKLLTDTIVVVIQLKWINQLSDSSFLVFTVYLYVCSWYVQYKTKYLSTKNCQIDELKKMKFFIVYYYLQSHSSLLSPSIKILLFLSWYDMYLLSLWALIWTVSNLGTRNKQM